MAARAWRALLPLARRAALPLAAGASLYLLLRRRPRKRAAAGEPHAALAPAKVGVNAAFVAQLRKLLPVLFPTFFCREVALLGAHTVCLLARTVASIWLAQMDGRIVKALVTGKGRKFLTLLAIWLATSVPIAFVNAAIKFLKQSLALAFRTRLTKKVCSVSPTFTQLTPLLADSRPTTSTCAA